MSHAFSPRVKKATEQLLSYVENDDVTPSEALRKVASECDLTPELMRLVGRAYNTSCQMHQSAVGEDTLAKLASFPLVDIEAVIAEVFTGKQAAAPEILQFGPVKHAGCSSDYDHKPVSRYKSKVSKPEQQTTKMAHTVAPALTVYRQPELSDAEHLAYAKQAACLQVDAQKQAAKLQAGLVSVRSDAAEALRKLAAYFELPQRARLPYPEFVIGAESLLGKSAQAYLELLPDSLQTETMPHNKTAGWSPVVTTAKPYDLLLSVDAAFKTAKAYREHVTDMITKMADHVEAVFARLDPELADYINLYGEPPATTKTGSVGAGILGGIASTAAGKSIAPKSQLVEELSQKLKDPNHLDKIRQLEATTSLHELLQYDPVISSYSPAETVHAYNELVQLAPRLANQPAALRPQLRRWLVQGQIEPFEAQQIAQLENTVADSQKSTRMNFAPQSSAV